MTVQELTSVIEGLAALEDPKVRAVNERHGDDHGVNLTKLRGLAKVLKRQPELARQLWATGNSNERLLAILITRPKDWTAKDYDAMLRDARTPKVRDWLVNYLVVKSPFAEQLRISWFEDSDQFVASAGWALTTNRVVKDPDGVDMSALLDHIEADMQTAPEQLQWAMNTCLGNIGIEHPEHRDRVLDIGERLEVLKDYPTPPNCVSPYVPLWVSEMVSRKETAK